MQWASQGRRGVEVDGGVDDVMGGEVAEAAGFPSLATLP